MYDQLQCQRNLDAQIKDLQSFTKYLTQTLAFMSNSKILVK